MMKYCWIDFLSRNIHMIFMRTILQSIGPMPKDDICRRALWVGSLVNPLPSLKLCFEIRPAMLACKNNYERIQLAVISLQSSIDFLSSRA